MANGFCPVELGDDVVLYDESVGKVEGIRTIHEWTIREMKTYFEILVYNRWFHIAQVKQASWKGPDGNLVVRGFS